MIRRRRKKRRIGRIRYELAPDLQLKTEEICRLLFPHVRAGFFKCFRSFGSSSSRVIARCHGLAKIMQEAIGCPAYYAIEFLSERFDGLSQEEQTKTIIHELMHIPNNFGGGFRYHNSVTKSSVNRMYEEYRKVNGEVS